MLRNKKPYNKKHSLNQAYTLPAYYVFLIYAHFVLFYISNIYDFRVSSVLIVIKWAPILLLTVLMFSGASRLKGRQRVGGFSILAICAIVFLYSLSTFLGGYNNSSAYVLTSIVVGVFVASRLNRHSQAIVQVLQIVKWTGVAVILATGVFFALGLNLGRAQPRFSGWVDNPNTLALMIVPAIIILIVEFSTNSDRLRFAKLFVIVLGCWLLIQTGSRASMVWLLASVAAYFLLKQRSNLLMLIGLAMLPLLMVGADLIEQQLMAQGVLGARDLQSGVLSGRDEVWQFGWETAKSNIILGYGAGSSEALVQANMPFFLNHHGLQLHNSYLTIAVEAGWTTTLLFAGVIFASFFSLLRKNGKNQRSLKVNTKTDFALQASLLFGASIHGFFETWLISAGNIHFLWLWMLIFSALSVTRKQSQFSPRATRGKAFA